MLDKFMTLTELKLYVRKLAPFVLGIGIFLIILYFAVTGYLNYLEARRPKTLTIEPIFGKINKIALKKTFGYPANPKFILDTIEGRPETATRTAKVFFLPPATARFGYLGKIYLMAKKFGFDTETTRHKIQNSQAVFEDAEKKLTVDVATFNFTYQYRYQNNESVFETAALPEAGRIKETLKSFLAEAGRYPEELTQGRENLLFLKYDAQTKDFATVARAAEANAVELDFFRPDIDGAATLSPTYFTAPNFIVASFSQDAYTILKAQIHFFEKENERFGVYPLKSGEEAWGELQNQQGLIVSTGRNLRQITIKKMMLGYLDPEVYQLYLQPVYYFLSSDGFVGYVPAVRDDYTE